MRVVCVDFPGHGRTSHNKTGAYTLYDYLIFSIRVIHSLDVDSIHLMAHSLGAIMAPLVASMMPQTTRIKSVICIEQFGMYRRSLGKGPDVIDLLPSEDSAWKMYDSLDRIVESRISVTENKYPGEQTISERAARAILQRNVRSVTVVDAETRQKSKKLILAFDQRLRGGSTSKIMAALPISLDSMKSLIVENLKCPTLAIYAEKGWPNLDFLAKQIECELENMRIVRTPGSHHVHIDTPEICLEHIIPFLETVLRNDGRVSKL